MLFSRQKSSINDDEFGNWCWSTLRSLWTSHLASMKLLTIFVIICRSTHGNNNNYISLFVIIYIYSVGAKVDIITLFNYLGLFISYNMLLRKLRDITSLNANFIKEQATNYKLVNMWDNFKYQKNIAEEKIYNTIKFRFVNIVLWIKNKWKILATSLKQWMWNIRQDIIDPDEFTMRLVRPEGIKVQNQCIISHRL